MTPARPKSGRPSSCPKSRLRRSGRPMIRPPRCLPPSVAPSCRPSLWWPLLQLLPPSAPWLAMVQGRPPPCLARRPLHGPQPIPSRPPRLPQALPPLVGTPWTVTRMLRQPPQRTTAAGSQSPLGARSSALLVLPRHLPVAGRPAAILPPPPHHLLCLPPPSSLPVPIAPPASPAHVLPMQALSAHTGLAYPAPAPTPLTSSRGV